MTPYLVGATWLDLEHVQGISQRLSCDWNPCGTVILAFRNEPLKVWPLTHWNSDEEKRRAEAQAIWDAFIAAWKSDTGRHALGEMISEKTREFVCREMAKLLKP